ncbi:MAG: hypothetical protein WHX53_04240 [Anaerolineae bacterium]
MSGDARGLAAAPSVSAASHPALRIRADSLIWLGALLVAALALSLFVGRYPAPPILAPERLLTDELAQSLVWNLRLPRSGRGEAKHSAGMPSELATICAEAAPSEWPITRSAPAPLAKG